MVVSVGDAMKRRPLASALGGVLALLVAFALGLLLRPSLDSLVLRRELSIQESRGNLRNWQSSRVQVLVTQWKLTGESDRSSGRDDLIWLWRIVFLNASSLGDCVVRVTRFSLEDPQGFEVAVSEAAPQETVVRPHEVGSVSGSGRLSRVRTSPKLRPSWELQRTCPKGLPQFGEAKVTEILETTPKDRQSSSRDWSDDRDSSTLGPVAKVHALHWSVAKYIEDARERDEEDQRKAGAPRRRDTIGDAIRELFRKPVAIQIQFPRGAKLRVGDVIYTFDQDFVKDEAGVRSVGYAFTSDGSSLPVRHWYDEPRPLQK